MNNNHIITIVVIFVVIFVVETLVRIKLRKSLGKNLLDKDFASFDAMRNNRITMLLIPKGDLYFYDLNKAIATKNDVLIDSAVKRLEDLKLSPSQKQTVYSTVFYHYLQDGDNIKIKPYYEKLSTLSNGSISEEDVLYDTYILKGYKYLDFVEELYKKASDDKKTSIEALLSNIYKNKGDKDKANYYFNKAKERIDN